ncbi:MAG: hypothetical protein LBV42_02650 [Methanobrevibacter sp.]|jgi:hypothetical protein|nr:hypothetical protein [Methanobrevibacter sp.]
MGGIATGMGSAIDMSTDGVSIIDSDFTNNTANSRGGAVHVCGSDKYFFLYFRR